MSKKQCDVCQTDLQHIATDRGYWFWCKGCGSLFNMLATQEKPRLVESPGVLAALRVLSAKPRQDA
jgi:hypothetical protein